MMSTVSLSHPMVGDDGHRSTMMDRFQPPPQAHQGDAARGHALRSAPSGAGGARTSIDPAGGSPNDRTTHPSSNAASSETRRKSRMAVPVQLTSTSGAPRPESRSVTSTVRKSTLKRALPEVFGTEAWSCAPENSTTPPTRGRTTSSPRGSVVQSRRPGLLFHGRPGMRWSAAPCCSGSSRTRPNCSPRRG